MTQVPLTCIPGQELHGLAGLICISWLLVGSHEPCPTGQTSDADHMNLGMPNTHNGLARSSRTALSKCEWCAGPRCLPQFKLGPVSTITAGLGLLPPSGQGQLLPQGQDAQAEPGDLGLRVLALREARP